MRTRAVYRVICEQRPFAVEALRTAQIFYKKGHLIRSPGDPDQRVYTLYSGWAIRVRSARDGRRQVLSVYLPGNLIGVESLGGVSCDFGVRAVTDVTLCEFDAAPLLSLLINTDDSLFDFIERGTLRRTASDEMTFALGRCSAIERMVQLILGLRKRLLARGFETDGSFLLPLRRDDFADMLGLTPVHVSRILGKLQREGLLEIRNHRVTILDVARLQKIANIL